MNEQTMVHPDRNGTGSLRCTGCGSPLASDQRYCLECGKRKGEPRIDFPQYLPAVGEGESSAAGGGAGQGPPETVAETAAPDNRPQREITPLMAAAGLAGLAVVLLLGVLIGRTGQDSSQPVVAATGLPTTAAASTSTGASETVSIEIDWPAGKDGFTVELATVSNSTDGAAVEATQADLEAQGAPEVGVLDSDEYASLPAGNYVFYSGVFDSRADAQARLKEVEGSFPDAQVVEVSAEAGGGKLTGGGAGGPVDTGNAAKASEIEDLESEDPGAYQEQLKKLPDDLATEGETVAPDNKAPGGGSDAVAIG